MFLSKICFLRYNLQSILNLTFYLFVFLLPWQTIYFLREPFLVGEKWHYGTIGVYFSSIFLLIWIFLEIFKQRYFLLKILKGSQKLFWLAFLFLLFCFISIFSARDQWLAFYFFTINFFGFTLFYLFKNANIDLKKVIQILILSALIQSIFGFYQFVFQTTFSNKYLGLQEHIVWQGGTSVIENESGRWLRAYGSFTHPNILGGFLAIIFIFTLYDFLFSAKNKHTLLKIFSLNFIFLGILTSFSRSAFLSFFVANFIIFTFIFFYQRQILRKFFTVVLTLFFTFSIFFFFYSNLFCTRVNLENRLEQKSVNERVEQINQSFSIVKQYFWQGIGWGNYTLFLYDHDFSQKPIWQYQPVHNIYLLTFVELGILGLLSFLFFIFFIFYDRIRLFTIHLKKINKKENFLVFNLIAFFSLLMIGLFDHWIHSFYFGIIFFWFLVGLVNKGLVSES